MKIFVAGYKGKGFGGAIIKRFTFGGYSHVSLVFEHDELIREEIESIQGKGVHSQEFVESKDCDLFRVECTDEQAEYIYQSALELIGCKYDWAGIWGFICRRKRENSEKWFCSELVAYCLETGGVVLQNLPAWKQSPVISCASVRLKKISTVIAMLLISCQAGFSAVNVITNGSSFSTWRTNSINPVILQSNTNVLNITATSNAFVAADAVISSAYISADTAVSNAFVAADTTISNALSSANTATSNAFISADTAVSNAFVSADAILASANTATSNAFVSADTAVSNAFIAADTALSNVLAGTAGISASEVTNISVYTISTSDVTNLVSGTAASGYVPTANGSGGIAWLAQAGGGGVTFADLSYTPGDQGGDTNNIALGTSSVATNANAIAIGVLAAADGISSLALSDRAASSGDYSISIGGYSVSAGEFGVAIGDTASAGGDESISIGSSASASASDSVAIGSTTAATAGGAVAIGRYSRSAFLDSFCFATSAGNAPTAAGQFYVFTDLGTILDGAPTTIENATADAHAVNRITGDGRWLLQSAGYDGTKTIYTTGSDGTGIVTNTITITDGQITNWTP